MKLLTSVAVFCLLSASIALADTVKAPVTTDPLVVPIVVVEAPKLTIEQKIRLTFNDPRMVPVLYCESHLHQFWEPGTPKAGKPKISPTGDVGVGQVNQTHWAKAKKLGLDIFNDEDDNLTMAKMVYDEQGIEAWSVFEGSCYQKHLYMI